MGGMSVLAEQHVTSSITLVLVEDHPALRQGLELLLRRQGLEVAGVAGSAAEAWDLLGEVRPNVVVLDLGLPDGSGAELCKRLLERDPELGVLIYTGAGEDEALSQALNCGARGYALKAGSPGELVEAIQAVARGASYLDSRLAPLLLARQTGRRTGLLTAREREMLSLLARGMTGEAIAEHLFLSPETVRTHIRNAMEKLEASTRIHAVAIAVREGEITL